MARQESFINNTKRDNTMPQELKKKLIGFITDERGTISKQNLIRGAITLSSIAASVSVVRGTMVSAQCSQYGTTQAETIKNPMPLRGLSQTSTQYSAMVRAGVTGAEGSTNVKTWNCKIDDYKTTCTTTQSCSPRTNNNVDNSGRYVHRNADAAMHTNNLNLDYNDKQALFKGAHGHHGQHDKFDAPCVTTNHGNHCQHCSHKHKGKM